MKLKITQAQYFVYSKLPRTNLQTFWLWFYIENGAAFLGLWQQTDPLSAGI